jgi:ribose 1,5-bisphosphokinase
MSSGQLFYVIGASGSGKDSLIRYARERTADRAGIMFARRYITRPADALGEDHIALSEAEFEARAAAGLFAMHWRSHGLRYAVGAEIDPWLASGGGVVMNGSREYLEAARRSYAGLTVVLVTIRRDRLAARLTLRGRETTEQIMERLARAEAFAPPTGPVEVIENDGELREAGERLLRLLTAAPATSASRG